MPPEPGDTDTLQGGTAEHDGGRPFPGIEHDDESSSEYAFADEVVKEALPETDTRDCTLTGTSSARRERNLINGTPDGVSVHDISTELSTKTLSEEKHLGEGLRDGDEEVDSLDTTRLELDELVTAIDPGGVAECESRPGRDCLPKKHCGDEELLVSMGDMLFECQSHQQSEKMRSSYDCTASVGEGEDTNRAVDNASCRGGDGDAAAGRHVGDYGALALPHRSALAEAVDGEVAKAVAVDRPVPDRRVEYSAAPGAAAMAAGRGGEGSLILPDAGQDPSDFADRAACPTELFPVASDVAPGFKLAEVTAEQRPLSPVTTRNLASALFSCSSSRGGGGCISKKSRGAAYSQKTSAALQAYNEHNNYSASEAAFAATMPARHLPLLPPPPSSGNSGRREAVSGGGGGLVGATSGAAPYAVGVSVMQPPQRGRGATAGAGAGVVLQPPTRGTKKLTSSSKKLERNRQRHKNRVVSKPFSCLQKLSVEPPPTPIRRNSPSASAALPIAPETRAQGTPEAAQHDHQMELELLQLQQHRALSMPPHLHAPAAPLFSSATELRSCSTNTTMRGAGAGEYAQLHLAAAGHQPLLSTTSRIRKMCSSGKMPSSSKKSAKHKSRSTSDRHSITFGDLEAVGCSLSTGSTPRGQMAASRAANVINPTRMSFSGSVTGPLAGDPGCGGQVPVEGCGKGGAALGADAASAARDSASRATSEEPGSNADVDVEPRRLRGSKNKPELQTSTSCEPDISFHMPLASEVFPCGTTSGQQMTDDERTHRSRGLSEHPPQLPCAQVADGDGEGANQEESAASAMASAMAGLLGAGGCRSPDVVEPGVGHPSGAKGESGTPTAWKRNWVHRNGIHVTGLPQDVSKQELDLYFQNYFGALEPSYWRRASPPDAFEEGAFFWGTRVYFAEYGNAVQAAACEWHELRPRVWFRATLVEN